MRRRGRILAWIGAVLVGLPLVLLVLVSTPPGMRLIVRQLLPKINAQLNGRLTAEGIGGSLLTRLELRDVTLRDPEGQVVLQAERLNVGYSVWDLLHSKYTLGPLALERPTIWLLKDHPGEQYSILRIFEKRDEGVTTASKGVDLTIRDVTLNNGAVIATVWRNPAEPRQEQAQPLDTVQLQNVNLRLALLHYSAGPDLERAALLEIDSARAFLSDPELDVHQLEGEAQLHGDSLVIVLRTIQLPASRLGAEAWLVTTPGQRRFDATAHVDELAAGDIQSFVSGAELPPEWRFRGDVRTTSLRSGSVLVQGRNLDITAAGGSVKGQVTLLGADNEWNAQNSRLEVAGVEVERLLRAFHVPSNLRARIDGTISADRQAGSADLRLAGAAGYGVRGPVNGSVRASGGRDAVQFETRLAVAGGRLLLTGEGRRYSGRAGGQHLALRAVRGDLSQFNLAAIHARLPQSRLNGHFEGDVVFGSMPREGNLRLHLDSSFIRGVAIDTAVIIAQADSGLLTADSFYVRASGLQMTGTGTFGLHEDQSGELTLTLYAPSLREVGPVVSAFTNDSLADIDGAVRVGVTASGSLRRYELDAVAEGHGLTVRGLEADSLTARAVGTVDSFRYGARLAVDSVTALSVGGRFSGRAVRLDSLTIERGDATWILDENSSIAVRDGTVRFDRAALRRSPASGVLTINGTYPGELTVTAERVPVADLLRKGERDSLPDLEGSVTYTEGAATGTVSLLTADSRPLTAEFTTKPFRGQLHSDSLDLSLFSPLVPSLRNLGGRLDGNLSVEGPTDAPRLTGRLQLTGGQASVPATGVAYHDVTATLTFSGDALQVEQTSVAAGKGRAELGGSVRFARLDRPELNIAVRTERFPVMNRHDFLEATATGALRLSGSPEGAVLTGRARVNEGNAYLNKFLRSSGIDLSDTLYAQFVDTTVLLQATGGRSMIESLMDSLRLDNVAVDLGDNFWLKSPDASIQLAGRLTVSTGNEHRETESAEKYRLVGTVRAVRGLYRMILAPGLTREFTVREGSIRFFGAPTKDAALDLGAEHIVRTARGEEVRITAHIGGTFEKPTIALTSDVSPPLSETELISYLVFGAPTAQAFLGRGGDNSRRSSVFEQSAEQLVGVLSGKIESAVISQLGLPLDYFRIKPGEVQSGLAGTELVLGMQVRILGFPSFLRASPRFCPRDQLLSLDHIGIELETRLSRQWGVATSLDPAQRCEAIMSGAAARPYQLGIDLFWEKR